ncbi:EAL domain-containing protein [Spirulina sp. CS-785/01]|uniref:two-component system response regulator n=1 Tax=Spirulina sp. CS-785/01 TaxID=3021716 RepID=UPI00232DA583|nr:EAL domain-containing protein [Spirulina sp. CS-785/01]MDB9313369.1 EAL domain-containing protein [Spirulina sp. CS-785/01]
MALDTDFSDSSDRNPNSQSNLLLTPQPQSQDSPWQADILIVDDTLDNLRLLSTMLHQQGYNVRKAVNGQMALTAIRTIPPDLVLLDIMMPDLNGYEVCDILQNDPNTADIPIIFLTALNDAFDKVKAFQVGGVDYITKPFQLEEVLVRVQRQIAFNRANQEIRQWNNCLEERVQQRTQQLEDAVQELHLEITERKRVQQQLLELAHHDYLTGLPNRGRFLDQLQEELEKGHHTPDYQFALLFLDCDRFKVINDSLGHSVGDKLLIAIAQRLIHDLAGPDALARMGGDEFALLIPDISKAQDVYALAEYLLGLFETPFFLQGREIYISASIGIVFGTHDYQQPEHLLRDADSAMYQAKATGKGRYEVFHPTMHSAALETLQLENDLRRAIERQEFLVYYQPLVDLQQGKIMGFEALVRWQHPQEGLLTPARFIPVAEETGLILEIGQQVLKSACQQLRDWQNAGQVSADICISVNLTAHQFVQANLVQTIDKILAETQLNPANLKLEITESAIMANTQLAATTFQQLRDRNIQLSIDDFGTGYSSLSYLHSFPVDILKIDKSFVQTWQGTPETQGLIPTILSIAQTMGMMAIAEGIETPQQLQQLRSLNCPYGQGFWFSQPVPPEEAVQLLAQEW